MGESYILQVPLPLGSVRNNSKGEKGTKVIKEMNKRVKDEDPKEIIPHYNFEGSPPLA
jgi:hypothetical protein